MQILLKLIIAIMFLLSAGAVWAAEQPQIIQCPAPTQLQTMRSVCGDKAPAGVWVVGQTPPKGEACEKYLTWRSGDDLSFAQKIGGFVGVQWQGISKMGSVICLYSGIDSLGKPTLFPIALQMVRPVIIANPTTSNWQVDEYGYQKCMANDPADCSFQALPQAKAPKNIYKALLDEKLNSSS